MLTLRVDFGVKKESIVKMGRQKMLPLKASPSSFDLVMVVGRAMNFSTTILRLLSLPYK